MRSRFTGGRHFNNRSTKLSKSTHNAYSHTIQAAGDGVDCMLKNCKSKSSTSEKSSSSESITDYSDDMDGTSKSASQTPELGAVDRTNLIVNYLPPSTSQEHVRTLFASIGEVENCKLVRENSTGESLGYAFVRYYNVEDAKKAIETFNGLKLENKTIKVSIARISCDAIKGANLYICGIPRSLKTDQLEDIFKSCGRIITTRILCDKRTSTSRGIAFIRYDQRSEAERAIKVLNGYRFPETNDVMTVKFANTPSSRSESRRSLSSRPTATSSSFHRRKKVSPASVTSLLHESECHESDDLNSTRLPSVNQLHMKTAPNFNQSKAFPFYPIQSTPTAMPQFGVYGNEYINRLFQSPPWPRTSLGLDQLSTWGRYFQYPTPLSKFWPSMTPHKGSDICCGLRRPNILFPNAYSQMHMPYKIGGHFQGDFEVPPAMRALFAPAYAANAGALTSNGWCIVIHNLSAETDDAVLWQLFGPFGAVNSVNVMVDPSTGKCKGYGFVTMSNYDEAVKAIRALSGFILDNRIIQVAFRTNFNVPLEYLCGRNFCNMAKCSPANVKRRMRRSVV